MQGKRIEVAVIVKQFITTLNAAGRDNNIDGPTDCYSTFTQGTEVSSRLNCNVYSSQFDKNKGEQQLSGTLKFPFIVETLQDFHKDQIACREWFAGEQAIEFVRVWRLDAVEVVDPDTGVYKDQRSFLMASKLPRHFTLPLNCRS
jgi:hypothetical protein